MTQPNPAPTGCPAHYGAARLYGDGLGGDTAALYRRLRKEHGSVAPVLLEGDIPAWLVLGYREVHQVTENDELFARDSRRWPAWKDIPEDWSLMPFVGYQPSVMFAEGAEHRRRSGAISDALQAVDPFELRQLCERVCDELVDSFSGAGEADLMARYALNVPLMVIADLFGFSPAEVPDLVKDVSDTLDENADAMAAHQRVAGRMARLVGERRLRAGADVPSRLLEHPAGLTDDEIVIDLLVVLAAAQQPTANWIGNSLRLMLTDDRFALTLSGGRRSVGQALTEVLWHDTPTQNFIGRWASRDTQLGGKHIACGDLVIMGLAAANTDPEVRPDLSGHTAEINQAHLSFSHGEHACPHPAPEIARVMTKTAVEVLLDRLPDVHLTIPEQDLVWHPSLWMRGLTALPVAFSPTHGSWDAEY